MKAAGKLAGAAGLLGLGLGALARSSRRFRSTRSIFDGKVSLITGGSRGLGFILARELAKRGSKLAICARNAEELKRARRELELLDAEVETYVCDWVDSKAVDRMIEDVIQRYGQIDVLINNAGIIQVGPVEAMTEKDFQNALRANLIGAFHTSFAALPHMIEAGEGRIVNITSIGGVVPVPHLLPYVTSKFGLVGFSLGLGIEMARHGIRVTTVAPGLMRTGSHVNALFKGNREAETNWFAPGASLPGISMDAERAARRIIRAAARGERFVTLGMPGKLMRLGFAGFPSFSLQLLEIVNRLLPHEIPEGSRRNRAEPGGRHRGRFARGPITILGDRAAKRFNETGS